MTKPNIIVIGTSAGGVDALCELNKHLPENLDASIFVVMHVGSETMLPQILSSCGNLTAVLAEHEKPYRRGCIYCAPARCHLSIRNHTTILTRGPRENGHRPAIDVLFRSAAREHRSNVIGVVLSGGRDDGSAGLFAIKARGGLAIVQDPAEAIAPTMPRNALNMVDVDFCLPVRRIAETIVQLTSGKATGNAESSKGEPNMNEATAEHPTTEPPGDQIPLACPECNGPIYETKHGELAHFECFVGHRFSPDSLSEQHTEALERALWTAARKLKERIVLHKRLVEQKTRNKGEEELRKRFEESGATAESDLKLLREILERI
jgi:two-component system chemotaxis response regulator CheB